jgi:protein SCO1/2
VTTALLRLVAAATVSVIVVASAAGCGGSQPASTRSDNPAGVVISGVHQNTRFFGAEPPRPYRMPGVTLTATNGAPFNLVRDTVYPVTLVFFGYTNCPDVCPLVMSDLTSTYLHLPAALRSQTQVLFITTDPARDDLATLRRYLDRYDSDFVGLTGKLKDIVAAGTAMGVAIEGKRRLPNGGYDVGHGAQVVGFAGHSAPVIWTGSTIGNVGDMVSDISRLAGSSP